MIWEKAVLNALRRIAIEKNNLTITRKEIVQKELKRIQDETNSNGRTPEQTLSRTLQVLRDQGAIDFLDGDGTYLLKKIHTGIDVKPGVSSASLSPINFIPGAEYNRQDLHARFRGQEQGGICTPSNFPIILLFTGESGHEFGYKDGWKNDIFEYTGEGQTGDMEFVRGNRAVRDHIKDGKDLYLFKYISSGCVQYIGQMVSVGWFTKNATDISGRERSVIVFELSPIEKVSSEDNNSSDIQPTESLEALKQKALKVAVEKSTPQERLSTVRLRAKAIRLYALKRANGKCECCLNSAPFRTADGQPFLESHHLRKLTDDGPDHPEWVAGICPNCHRRIHYGDDGRMTNERLIEHIRQKNRQ